MARACGCLTRITLCNALGDGKGASGREVELEAMAMVQVEGAGEDLSKANRGWRGKKEEVQETLLEK